MPAVASSVPVRQLSLFYALYFSLLGCIAPYWGLYLQQRSFSAQDIGLLMGSFGLVRILAPNIWAALSHRFRSPLQMVRLAGVMTLICFSFIWLAQSRSAVLLVMISYGFFWAAMLPQYEAITMQALNNQIGAYSRIRVWGSVGFILLVLCAGVLFDYFSVVLLPLLMLLLMLAVVINSLTLKSAAVSSDNQAAGVSFRERIISWPVISFIVMTVLLQISHGPYYTFFSIWLESHHYASWQIGVLWAAGVTAEVILFWQFHRLVNLSSLQMWCIVSLLLTALRWVLVALYPGNVLILLLAQFTHAFSFGAMHVVAMRYIHSFFPGTLQAKGQALYSSVGFGLGGAAGAWLSGMLWQEVGGQGVFLLASVAAGTALLIAWAGLRTATDNS